ncbi:MAG: erythromycin esterase family protein [Planctomycetota bacterium]
MLRLVPFLLFAGVALADDGWLAKNAVAFKTVEAGNGFEDLAFLKKMIGDARIVSLGEATHGTREFFQMKHRLLEFLATQMGFSIFSIEACMPEAYAVNDYVEHGKGDLGKQISGMYFWTWRTQEVRVMVEWMRSFNAAGNGPLRFTGFDMQSPKVAARNVALFARDDLQLRNQYAEIVKANRSIPQEFGGSSGVLPADDFRGKTVRISGKIRTKESGPAAFWIRADKGQRSVAFDNMRATAPFGTVGWKDYHVEIDVPDDADTIFFGLILKGGGTAWFDGVRILVDGKELKSSNLDPDFEGAGLHRAWRFYQAYRSKTVGEGAASGDRCLQVERLTPLNPPGLDPRKAMVMAHEALEKLAAYSDREGYAWAEQNARVVLQCMQSRARIVHRDLSMADNVAWILKRNPEAKVVLWAHNGHVARKRGWMGAHLATRFGKDYLPVGFTSLRGTYRGIKGGRLTRDELRPPPADSWERRLSKLGKPLAIVDLRGAPAELRKPIAMRSLGALVQEQQSYPHPAPEWFDLLVYIEESNAAVEMKR